MYVNIPVNMYVCMYVYMYIIHISIHIGRNSSPHTYLHLEKQPAAC